MSEYFLIGFASILVLGFVAQWLSWRFQLPSILILLIFGFLAGPVSGLLQPDEFFGKLLFPIVSISVAIILFEGGLSLKFRELKSVSTVVRNLLLIGIPVTFILSSLLAYFIIGLNFSIALLFGAILVVTGPTVIIPLLRQIRPTAQINTILKWEGIINDPIGALMAILVFEGIFAAGLGEATLHAGFSLLKTIIISTSVGLLGAYCIVLFLKYRLIPDFLQNPVSLTLVVAVFTISNLVQHESGLLAVTVMGIFLANQKSVAVKHIVEFKENLRILLISVLFIILAARLNTAEIELLNAGSFIFIILLLLVIRPAAVFLSTFNSKLNFKEKIFLSWMAPRGIVAAAVSSIFAIELVKNGYSEAQILVPLTFMVIIFTITLYGLSAMPLAKWLGIATPNPQGCLVLGANPFARTIAKTLKVNGYKVLLIDTNRANISAAKMDGLQTYYGSILSEYILSDIDLNGIGKLLAVTPNKEVNSLAAIYFSKIFGSNEVYQLSIEEDEKKQGNEVSHELRGQILFGTSFTFPYLINRFGDDLKIKSTKITEKFDYDAFLHHSGNERVIPLFLIDDGELQVFTRDNQPTPQTDQTLICLVEKELEAVTNS